MDIHMIWWQCGRCEDRPHDLSPANRDGALTGGAWTIRTGPPLTQTDALAFSGAGHSITATGYKGLLGDVPRTVEAWIKTDSNNGTILSFGGTESDKGRWAFQVGGVLRLNTYWAKVEGTTVVADGKWHHVACVYGGGGLEDIHFYVDGQLDAIRNRVSGPIDVTDGAEVRLGTDDYKTDFAGHILEVRVWSRARTNAEIQTCSLVHIDGDCPDLEACWPLLRDARDVTSNKRHGRVEGCSWEQVSERPELASAAYLSLSNINHCATAVGYKGILGQNPRTVEAWIKTEVKKGTIVSWGGTPDDKTSWGIYIHSDGTIKVNTYWSRLSGMTKVNDGTWHHVAVTYGGGSIEDIQIFVDGRLDEINPQSVAGKLATTEGADVSIGLNTYGNSFVGTITEVRIWSAVRTLAQIQADKDRRITGDRPDLAACWPLHHHADDVTSNGHRATITGATWSPPEDGAPLDRLAHLSLETDDCMTISGYAGILDGAPRTVEAWIRTSHPSGTIATWGDATNRWTLQLGSGGVLCVANGSVESTGTTGVADGKWHHIACAFGGGTLADVKFYVDGAPEDTQAPTAAEPRYQSVQITPVVAVQAPEQTETVGPLAVEVLTAPFDLSFEYEGEVTQSTYDGGTAFEGRATLTAPFALPLNPVRFWSRTIETGGQSKFEFAVRFRLPESTDLWTLLDEHVSPLLADATRAWVESLLWPYIKLYDQADIILANSYGKDPELGRYITGFNAISHVPAHKVPGLAELHGAFPELGLDGYTIVLGTGTATPPKLYVSGKLLLGIELGTPAIVFDSVWVDLRVAKQSVEGKDAKSTRTDLGVGLEFTLEVPDETLALRGGIGWVSSDQSSSIYAWGALDATDGAWKNPFGLVGLTINGMGVQIGTGPVIGVRGELDIGDGLVEGRVGILLDANDPRNTILDVYVAEGFPLPRIMAMISGGTLDPSHVLDVSLRDLQLYAAPRGGLIAGKYYSSGYWIRGTLDLWGWGAEVDAFFAKAKGGRLNAKLDRIVLEAGGYSFLEIVGAGGEGRAEINLEANFVSGQVNLAGKVTGRVLLMNGRYHGELQADVSDTGFRGSCMVSMWGKTEELEVVLDAGLFRVIYTPEIDVSVNVGGYRVGIKAACPIGVAINGRSFKQSIAFEFKAMGKKYRPGPFTLSIPVVSQNDVIAAFYKYAADLLTDGLLGTIADAAAEAFAWVRETISDAIEDVAHVFNQAGAAVSKTAQGLCNSFDVAADEALHAMCVGGKVAADILDGTFGWSEDQINAALKNTFGWSNSAVNAFRKTGDGFVSAGEEVKSWF